MNYIHFPNPSQSKKTLLIDSLEELRYGDTLHLGWAVNPESMAKGVMQNTQALLKRNAQKNGILRSFPVSQYFPYATHRRLGYHLSDQPAPGAKGAHHLLLNCCRVPILMMARHPSPPFSIIEHKAEYDFVNRQDQMMPATTLHFSDQEAFAPDGLVRIRLPDRNQVIWTIEADNATEPIVAKNHFTEENGRHETRDTLAKTSILYKVFRYIEYINDEAAYQHYQVDGEIVAFQSLWLFHHEKRLHQVREKLLTHLDRPRRFVWMTTREAIEKDVRGFWTAPVWYKLEPEAKPFALITNKTLTVDHFASHTNRKNKAIHLDL